jgi:2-polyprenyl-3-methyl-5-hydroxy-6-metoxy-1,4-benzoquinol methylase
MSTFDRHTHWEKIYHTKQPDEFSWYQPTPATSLEFFSQYHIPKTARIIDVGGGDSLLVDHLIDQGYRDITVLDISETAIDRAKARLGPSAKHVKWIVSDVVDFQSDLPYDFWHDRAAFHFLTRQQDIETYINNIRRHLTPQGMLVIGTFSEEGPKTCSGLPIRQYSESALTSLLQQFFEKIKCIEVDHKTPRNIIQHFIFCSFKRRLAA